MAGPQTTTQGAILAARAVRNLPTIPVIVDLEGVDLAPQAIMPTNAIKEKVIVSKTPV